VDSKGKGGDKRAWSSILPSLAALRKDAESLGVDTKPLGRSKTLILKALDKARQNAEDQNVSLAISTSKRKMVKTAPSIENPVLINPIPADDIPLKN
jgi:hypothetical protein